MHSQVHWTAYLCSSWLQMALINPTYKNIVEKMLQDLEALENIITASSSSDNDPVAMELMFWIRDCKMTML